MNLSNQGQPMLKDVNTIRAWVHAALADYVTPEEWQTWADRWIAKLDAPPIWMLELSASKSASDITSRLQQILEENALQLELSDGSLLGFLALSYERENLSLRALLQRAAAAAAGGNAGVNCETFWALLNRLEAGEDKKAIEEQFKEVTTSFRTQALAEWDEIRKWSAAGR